MRVKLHHLVVDLESGSPRIRQELRQLFAPFILTNTIDEGKTDRETIRFSLEMAQAPPKPEGTPDYVQHGLLIFQSGSKTTVHLPELGQLEIFHLENKVSAVIAPKAIDAYGVLEDMIAAGLAPLLRRHGCVLIHAFAASIQDSAMLLVGDNASGKTTTGLALLSSGWRLVANDSPMLRESGGRITAFAFPGLLSADAAALGLVFGSKLDASERITEPGQKISFPYEKKFGLPWQLQAPVRSICLLKLEPGASRHQFERLTPANALGRILPHSVDRWDQSTLSFQIDIFLKLVEQAPAFMLHLGPDVQALPSLLEQLTLQGTARDL